MTEGVVVPASDYLDCLLEGYQNAETVYSQAVSDVVVAEIRRDKAKQAKDLALQRFEEAHKQYGGSSTISIVEKKLQKTTAKSERTTPPKSSTSYMPSHHRAKYINAAQKLAGKLKNVTKEKDYFPPPDVSHSSSTSVALSATSAAIPNTTSMSHPVRIGNTKPPVDITNQQSSLGTKKPPLPKLFFKTNNKNSRSSLKDTTNNRTATKKTSSNMCNDKTETGNRAAVRNKKRTSRIVPAPLDQLQGNPCNVLGICKGRTRDWFQAHFDGCENNLGLVRHFYKASFGTQTNVKTKQVKVYSIVLDDNWNDFVSTTSDVQEIYIGNSPKIVKALVKQQPCQKEPIAIFFAPKKKSRGGTTANTLHYGGHWKIIPGSGSTHTSNPPQEVKGRERHCLVKFEFVGINQQIIEVMNQE